MGWTFFEVAEETLTAGEWEQVFLLVNLAVPHLEVELDPVHCPSCRIAHAAVLVARETDLPEAIASVAAMPALSLIDAFVPDSG